MIIEIALGIVLAVIIIYCLPLILTVGLALGLLALAAAAVYFLFQEPALLLAVAVVGGVIWLFYWDATRDVKPREPE